MPTARLPPTGDEFIPTRLSLLSRLKHWDDHEGWSDFFDTYWRFLHSLAIRAGLPEDDARDVVQETIVAVAKGLRENRFQATEGSSFKAWLKLIVQRRVADRLRLRRRRPDAEVSAPDDTDRTPLLERIAAPDDSVVAGVWEEEWARNLANLALERVKQRVSAKQFQMFDLYALKEWPVAEVAKMLHTNVAQVYLAKHRVTVLLRKETDRLRKRMDGP